MDRRARDRAIDYAAHRAKDDGAELLIVNVIGGYGLPDKVFMAFTDDQQHLAERAAGIPVGADTDGGKRSRPAKPAPARYCSNRGPATSRRRSSRSRRKRRRTLSSSANGVPGASGELCSAASRKSLLFFHLCR